MADDREILELYRVEGRKEYAFNLLISEYGERLYMHVRKMVFDHDDTDDILQNTFVKAWNALDSFRGDSGLYTWLYRIATNETISFLKGRRLSSFFSFSSYSSELVSKVEADASFDGDESLRKFYRAIAKLPDRQRLVFNMKYFEELKYEEISAILGVSVGSLKASYHHAVGKIKSYLESAD